MPDPFDTLGAVGAFLKTDVLPGVPVALASELRAAIKNLEDAARELATLHPRSERECHELVALCTELVDVLGENPCAVTDFSQRLADGFENTLDLLEFRTEVNVCLSQLIARTRSRLAETGAREREALDATLCRCFETLGRHAAQASQWQSVFEPPPVRTPDAD